MKRLFAGALALIVLICLTTASAAAPGSPSDPLMSLSYINNTFLPSVDSDTDALVDNAFDSIYTDAEQQLQAAFDTAMIELGNYEGYTFAKSYAALSVTSGKTVDLVTGSTLMPLSGTMKLQLNAGTIIDISVGSEIADGTTLTVGHRYFCAEGTSAVIKATANAVAYVDGFYKTSGSIIVDTNKFLDVQTTDWFYEAVTFVSDEGLFTGTSSTAFSPDTTMTRGMFVTVLYRLHGSPSVTSASAFSDVANASEYYYKPVVWAVANGVVNGYDDGTFRPNALITREQMAAILYRYAAAAGYSMTYGGPEAFNAFPDTANVSSYAVDSMKWATDKGLINGSGGQLLPLDPASRSQVAKIILEFCQIIVGM